MFSERQTGLIRPRDAHELGIGMVYRHSTLIPNMSVLENLVLARPRLDDVTLLRRGAHVDSARVNDTDTATLDGMMVEQAGGPYPTRPGSNCVRSPSSTPDTALSTRLISPSRAAKSSASPGLGQRPAPVLMSRLASFAHQP